MDWEALCDFQQALLDHPSCIIVSPAPMFGVKLIEGIQKLFTLPGETRVFMCHDYKAPGREEFLYETTIAAEREHNVHIHSGISEEQFVAMRTARDATLGMPTLILPSVQINMRGGELPEPESNGTRYLKIPLDVL